MVSFKSEGRALTCKLSCIEVLVLKVLSFVSLTHPKLMVWHRLVKTTNSWNVIPRQSSKATND